jgi:hypothetical protein
MKPYLQLRRLYQEAATWEEFLDRISSTYRKTLLEAIEEGWRAKIFTDLLNRYKVDKQKIQLILDRYECINDTTPYSPSSLEVLEKLNQLTKTIDLLKGYLRYAYFTALDEEDTIISTADRILFQLSEKTPTKEECAKSYTTVTGKYIKPETVVLDAAVAERIADLIAGLVEDLLKHKKAIQQDSMWTEAERLNNLHIRLTGRSIL